MAANMIPANVSLVRYDNPVLVTKHSEKKSANAKDKVTKPVPPEGLGPVPTAAQSTPSKRTGHGDTKQDTEEVLNSIIPPREWEEEGGQLWRQQVSTTPATRLDVLNLQEQLDMKLQQRQARETGICPVRRELYSQAFDEVIRQVRAKFSPGVCYLGLRAPTTGRSYNATSILKSYRRSLHGLIHNVSQPQNLIVFSQSVSIHFIEGCSGGRVIDNSFQFKFVLQK